jgi:hypothetical protein
LTRIKGGRTRSCEDQPSPLAKRRSRDARHARQDRAPARPPRQHDDRHHQARRLPGGDDRRLRQRRARDLFRLRHALAEGANLARNPKVSIAIDRDYDNWAEIEGLSLAGTAERVTGEAELARAGELFLAKFPQIANFSEKDLAVMAIYRVTPIVFSVLDYRLGFGHSDLLTV